MLACISLWARKVGWRRVGLAVYRNWKLTVGLGMASGVLLESFELLVSQPLLVRMTGKQPDLEDFRSLVGNWKLTLIFLVLTWTLAAFGEEMVYRGYLPCRRPLQSYASRMEDQPDCGSRWLRDCARLPGIDRHH